MEQDLRVALDPNKYPFLHWLDLAAERLGGKVLTANDEFFAPKENLIKPGRGEYIPDKYTDRGKWMDGWETRRRRTPGHDWCILRLGFPGIVHGVDVDTNHFLGNFPQSCSLELGSFDHLTDKAILSDSALPWAEVLPQLALRGGIQNLFSVETKACATHARFNIYPDGGVARLRIYGEVVPNWEKILQPGLPVDLAAAAHGGLVVACNDMFFGKRGNLILPGRAQNMGDGWETRRRRGPGNDWCVVKLGRRGRIQRLEIDTEHFKGNCPESASVDASCSDAVDPDRDPNHFSWVELLPRVPLTPNELHTFTFGQLCLVPPATHVRLNVFPDGGIARFRVWGVPE